MKKLISLVIIMSALIYCTSNQEKAQRIIENGVEVVLNTQDSIKGKSKSSGLELEIEFSINTESEGLVKAGLTQVQTFDVDSEGNIYFLNSRSKENIIFTFDKSGNYINSSIRKGQGPGEVQLPLYFQLNKYNEFVFTDAGKVKLSLLSKEGELKKEIPISSDTYRIKPLDNGKLLLQDFQFDPEGNDLQRLYLCSPDLKEQKELDKIKIPSPFSGKQAKGIPYVFAWGYSNRNIYVGNEERGYEIWVFDLDGNLKRKIRKEFKPVEVTEAVKKEQLERAPENIRKYLYFPKHMPPFQYLFADDKDNLFVMTYEQGEAPREFQYDVFNADGVFVGRVALDNYADYFPLDAKAKNNRLYCLRETGNGYKELVVYRIKWR